MRIGLMLLYKFKICLQNNAYNNEYIDSLREEVD